MLHLLFSALLNTGLHKLTKQLQVSHNPIQCLLMADMKDICAIRFTLGVAYTKSSSSDGKKKKGKKRKNKIMSKSENCRDRQLSSIQHMEERGDRPDRVQVLLLSSLLV